MGNRYYIQMIGWMAWWYCQHASADMPFDEGRINNHLNYDLHGVHMDAPVYLPQGSVRAALSMASQSVMVHREGEVNAYCL